MAAAPPAFAAARDSNPQQRPRAPTGRGAGAAGRRSAAGPNGSGSGTGPPPSRGAGPARPPSGSLQASGLECGCSRQRLRQANGSLPGETPQRTARSPGQRVGNASLNTLLYRRGDSPPAPLQPIEHARRKSQRATDKFQLTLKSVNDSSKPPCPPFQGTM